MSFMIKSITLRMLQSNRKYFNNLFRYRQTFDRVRFDFSFKCHQQLNYSQTLNKMPPKKATSSATKRKTAEQIVPKVKDPFSASKRPKKEDNDVVEIENEKLLNKADMNHKEESENFSSNGTKNNDEKKQEPSKSNENSVDAEDEEKKENIPKSKGKKSKKEQEEDEVEEIEIDEDNKTETSTTISKLYNKDEFAKCSNGKDWNFKICSWNINGIRAWLEHGGLDYLKAEDPDIFCCQETKCDKSKIPPKAGLKGYHSYWLSGDTQGYSGVGLLTKIKPLNVSYGINNKKFDNEGRVIVAEYEKFYLINSYIPNSSRGLVRLGFRMEWEVAFLEYLKSLDAKKPVIWCGDLNVAHNEIDLKNPESNKKTAGFTKEERDCFTKLLSNGFVDSFRHLYPTLKDQYTYWSYFRNAREKNVGWRLDYFILSERFNSHLVDNMIRCKVLGSDHCPIVLFLKLE